MGHYWSALGTATAIEVLASADATKRTDRLMAQAASVRGGTVVDLFKADQHCDFLYSNGSILSLQLTFNFCAKNTQNRNSNSQAAAEGKRTK